MKHLNKNTTDNLKGLIGENIRRIRLNTNIEVKQLCADLGLSAAAYSNIERGITDINISRLMQLADYFKVHFNQILTRDNPGGYAAFTMANGSIPLSQRSATMDMDIYGFALQQVKEENAYLKLQNTKLLNILEEQRYFTG